jgi:hypothetical protein
MKKIKHIVYCVTEVFLSEEKYQKKKKKTRNIADRSPIVHCPIAVRTPTVGDGCRTVGHHGHVSGVKENDLWWQTNNYKSLRPFQLARRHFIIHRDRNVVRACVLKKRMIRNKELLCAP